MQRHGDRFGFCSACTSRRPKSPIVSQGQQKSPTLEVDSLIKLNNYKVMALTFGSRQKRPLPPLSILAPLVASSSSSDSSPQVPCTLRPRRAMFSEMNKVIKNGLNAGFLEAMGLLLDSAPEPNGSHFTECICNELSANIWEYASTANGQDY